MLFQPMTAEHPSHEEYYQTDSQGSGRSGRFIQSQSEIIIYADSHDRLGDIIRQAHSPVGDDELLPLIPFSFFDPQQRKQRNHHGHKGDGKFEVCNS